MDTTCDYCITPRRSPRLTARDTFDVYVHELSPDMKVSSESDVLHRVSNNSSLLAIVALLKTYEEEKKMYTPAKGLFWIRKGTKQIVSLRGTEDLEACKLEYKGSKSIHLACQAVNLEKGTVFL